MTFQKVWAWGSIILFTMGAISSVGDADTMAFIGCALFVVSGVIILDLVKKLEK